MKKPIIAIVGRPNVGKSSLFNLLARRKIAVVHDMPGVTRDRIYADVTWGDNQFTIVDTGGLDPTPIDELIDLVQIQVEAALAEADAIFFLVDVRDGIMPQDEIVAAKLRQTNKPVFLIVNKVDSQRWVDVAADFYEFGLNSPYSISCTQNLGVDVLVEDMLSVLPDPVDLPDRPLTPLKIAIAGRPNAGKSLLINTILGEDRMIVSDIPGTTRDAINIHFVYQHIPFELIDTAGMRRKSSVTEKLEKSSVQRAIRSIRQSDIAWLVLDATRKISRQDKTIGDFIAKQGTSCVIAVNKWDLIEKDNTTFNQFADNVYRAFPQLTYVPLVFISAKTGQRVNKMLDASLEIHRAASTRIPTPDLNDLLTDLKNQRQPPYVGRFRPKLRYITQVEIQPPTFLIFGTNTDKLQTHYESYIINNIRQAFGFEGAPIRVFYRANAKFRKGEVK